MTITTATTTAITTSEIDPAVIDNYANDLAEFYGVNSDDVTIATKYEATGTMQVTIPDDASEEEIANAITSSIAETLGVHHDEVEVIVNMETGELEFTISSESWTDLTL